MAPGRQPLALRNGNVSAFPAPPFEAKRFVSAYNLLQTSPLSTDAPAAPLHVGGKGQERTSESGVINALYRSAQGGSDPSPVDPAAATAALSYNSELDFVHRDLLPARARPPEAARGGSAPSVPAPVAHSARAGPAVPAAPVVSACVDAGAQSRVQAGAGNTERAVASLVADRFSTPVASLVADRFSLVADSTPRHERVFKRHTRMVDISHISTPSSGWRVLDLPVSVCGLRASVWKLRTPEAGWRQDVW
jgi:hypothetical protein